VSLNPPALSREHARSSLNARGRIFTFAFCERAARLRGVMMHLACLDLEGVLIPEIWKAVATLTGVDALNRTTRDEPDYDKLMRYRLDILDREGITIHDIQKAIATLEPLPGALEFCQWLRSQTRVIILSDTFAEFAAPLMAQLEHPTLFCHNIETDEKGRVTNYCLRQDDQKRKAVEAFQMLQFHVIASGDSYNDLTMLRSADQAILYRPSDEFAQENSDLPVTHDYAQLKAAFEAAFARAE